MTRFIDGFGRTISRDERILENLVTRYKDTNMMILAQAGKEIEALQEEVGHLRETIAALKSKPAAKPPLAK